MTLCVQTELADLWDQSCAVDDDGYERHAVRLDPDAFTLLKATVNRYPYAPELEWHHSGPPTWRHLPIILEVPPLRGPVSHTAKPDDVVVLEDEVSIITLELRQPGEHGRSQYLDWKRP